MSQLALARKWRPRCFADVMGQSTVVQAFSNALTRQQLHHAYLLTGTRGVGKTTLARILAKCLNCEVGISATPCDQCDACKAVDAGRFVDLLEVDAASRTKVEDTRELLENVQYLPSQGRYKVYIIDEVHMLSGHSFNALLKTLEEPPSHVIFLLATTDPQKLPATVLSRCLQFHLLNLSTETCAEYMAHVLNHEKIPFDQEALQLLGEAAQGSMRDALSLLDQAIAFGNGEVTQTTVQQMLGSIDQQQLQALLEALIAEEPQTLFSVAQALAQQGANLTQVLKELIHVFHNIALAQFNCAGKNAKWKQYANQITPEMTQLYYQIALRGLNDLPLAPTAKIGFEMTLLRLLHFKPSTDVQHTASQQQVKSKTKSASKAVPKEQTPTLTPENWPHLADQLGVTGATQALANQLVLTKIDDNRLQFTIHSRHKPLINDRTTARLEQALAKYTQKNYKISIAANEEEQNTPAKVAAAQASEREQQMQATLEADSNVQQIMQTFNANIVEGSIKPSESS